MGKGVLDWLVINLYSRFIGCSLEFIVIDPYSIYSRWHKYPFAVRPCDTYDAPMCKHL